MNNQQSLITLISELREVLGPEGVLTGAAVSGRLAGIWRADAIAAPVIFRPANTSEVAAVLRACHAVKQPVVIHGGLTGLAEGAIASANDVVLSTERLKRIESVSVTDRSMCVQAGVTLQTAQDAAATEGLMLGLDLGARGSCTIGGNVATNAGGHQVIRYGMTRDVVLGVEVVLADGTVVSSLNEMLKNNAGYDLKQLFIGSEGTLGVITRVVLRLRPVWRSQETALVACEDFSQVVELLRLLDAQLGGTLSAFELFWQNYYELVAAGNPPLDFGYPFYVLVEALGDSPISDHERFLDAMATASATGLVADAVLCKSGDERQSLWALRDSVEKTLQFGRAFIFDVSLRLSQMDGYVEEVLERLDREFPSQQTWVFGHAGDGNLHFVVAPAEANDSDAVQLRERVERAIYEPLQVLGGSISGEHGIGLEKKRWLAISRNPEELELMRRLKIMLDPHRILNPGRIFDV
jgi:FAD/FMN-containing dehydrogenase